MPSSPSRFIPRGRLTISEISKYIPKSWKQPPRPIRETPKTHDESVLGALFKSLGHFIAQGHLYEAFRTFSILRHNAGSSHEFVLHSAASLLSTCVDFNELATGQQIHAHCISSGLAFDPDLVTITESSDLLHPLPWKVLIDSYVRNKRYKESVFAYKRMVSKGIRPDAFTHPSVLKACGALLDFETGRVVHGSIEVSSHRRNLSVCNALISMYKRFGKVDIARKLFDRMSERDAVSWNSVIDCYASEGKKFFDRMLLSGVQPTVVTLNTLAGNHIQAGNYVGALNVVAQMRNCDIRLDSVTMINCLKACSQIGAIRWGKEIHGLAICNCCNRIDNVRNSLITMYSRCDDLRHAYIVFLEQIEGNSLSSWNSIISGYAHNKRSEDTFILLKEMLLAGFHPNHVTLATILPLCENLQHGKEFHCYILRRQRYKDCLILWNSLVDMYAKSGEMKAAKRVYDSMSERAKVTYIWIWHAR